MRILTYKRTHVGDPDRSGRFGVFDCMGRVRSYNYDAVIGIGGIGAEPKRYGIDGKINWVGIGPTRSESGVVTFEHFLLLEELGPLFKELAPQLAARMYGENVRVLTRSYAAPEQAEAEKVLTWSRSQKAQQLLRQDRSHKHSDCRSRCKPVRMPESRGRCR